MAIQGLTSAAYSSLTTLTRPADTTTYDIGDSVSNSTTAPLPLEFENITPTKGGLASINEISIYSSNGQNAMSANVHIFTRSPTATNDNSTLAISTSDMKNLVYTATIGSFITYPIGSGWISNTSGIEVLVPLDRGDTSLYALIEDQGGYTPASEEVFTIKLIGRVY